MDGKLRCMTSIYLTSGNKILLLYRRGSRVVNNQWIGSAGGHFEKDELNDAGACVLRELEEELGIGASEIEGLALRYVTLRRIKGEIRQNYYFFAEWNGKEGRELASNEGEVRWFDCEELFSLEMPFTAKWVMQHYVQTGRMDGRLYGGIADGSRVVFVETPED